MTVVVIVILVIVLALIVTKPKAYEPKYVFRSKEQQADKYYDFRDHFREKCKDMSHLSPHDADRELRTRKFNGDFIPTDEYNGYQDVINSPSNKVFQDKINGMTSQQVWDWIQQPNYQGRTFTTDTMILIASKLKPFHERELLKILKTVAPEHVPNWIAVYKKRGYYFSDLVYQKAKEKFDSSLKRHPNN